MRGPQTDKGDPIVALYNGAPVRWSAVSEKVRELNLRGAIGNYVRWRVVADRKKELGIVNTPGELRRRAETVARASKERLGEKAFKTRLAAEGLTEEAYLDHVVGSLQLDYTLTVEKIVRYNERTGESFRIDRILFTDEKDAGSFADRCRETGFVAARAELQKGTFLNTVTQHPETIHVVTESGIQPPLDPWIIEKLRTLKNGDVTGVERSGNNQATVIRLIERKEGRAVSYQDVKGDVLESILDSPPDPQEAQRWVSAAAGKVSVEIKK